MLDFIEDARDVLQMEKTQIFDTILHHSQAATEADFEDSLQMTLEQQIKDKKVDIYEMEENFLKKRFKLTETQDKLSKKQQKINRSISAKMKSSLFNTSLQQSSQQEVKDNMEDSLSASALQS